MTDLRKAAEMALDYIEQALQLHDQQYQRHPSTEKDRQAIVDDLEALRQALTQHVDAVNMSQECVDETAKSEQEPVACIGTNGELMWLNKPKVIYSKAQPLYTAPPKREWVGLTDEDLVDCESEEDVQFVKRIEAKLKEKNT